MLIRLRLSDISAGSLENAGVVDSEYFMDDHLVSQFTVHPGSLPRNRGWGFVLVTTASEQERLSKHASGTCILTVEAIETAPH